MVKTDLNPPAEVESADEILRRHPSTITFLRAGDLKIDREHYQRFQDRSKVADIARNFDPMGMGVLLVSHRQTSEFFIIDGAHRNLAAIQRYGEKHLVECKVFVGMSIEDEANVFYLVNSQRSPVKTLPKIRAALVAGDPVILEIAGILNELQLDYPWTGTGGQDRSIICWGALKEIYRRRGAEHLRQVLTLIDRTWSSSHTALQANFVKGVDLLIRFHSKDEYWSANEAASRLRELTAETIERESKDLRRGIVGRNRSAHYAIYEMLHFAYNKGRRSRRLDDLRTRESSSRPELRNAA